MVGYEEEEFSALGARGPGPGLRLAIFVAASIALMLADQRTDLLQGVRAAAATALHPLERAVSFPYLLGRLGDHFADRQTLIIQNADLQHDRIVMAARIQKLQALEAENARLRDLLHSAQSLKEKVLVADILDTSSDPYRHMLKLSKGSNDGVRVGQALIDSHGVLGQVSEVSAYSSIAVLITDPNHSIPVEISRNGLRTVARGQGNNQLQLPFLPTNADVRQGDLLYSSGLGGRYPAGYPVGKIVRVEDDPGIEFLGLYAEPAAQLQHGHQVLLIVPPPPEAAARAAPKAETEPAKQEAKPKPKKSGRRKPRR